MKRLLAITYKEFAHIRRDRLTFMMIIGITAIYFVLFGFAINPDPKHQRLIVVAEDTGPSMRRVLAGLEASEYFETTSRVLDPAAATHALNVGEAQFALHFPPDFSQGIERGERPQLMLEVDATDPMAVNYAIAVFGEVAVRSLKDELRGAAAPDTAAADIVDVRVLRRYNPAAITQYNSVPGLLGVILTMTMVLMTALAVTREREKGTMEFLLATPVRPSEVLYGKILPYLAIGAGQSAFIFILSLILFHVPVLGPADLLVFCLLLFIVVNLAFGITISTLARTQLQAMQMSFFFFLPSILLSGFMFPYSGMPLWAQLIAEGLPMTHFQRLMRAVMLKGTGWREAWPHLWPMLVLLTIVLSIGVFRYRRTLD